ncbi:hypothetical protein Tco_1515496 [Tanacetum coccineum]
MAKRDEMAARKRRSKVDSSSIQVVDADDGGLPKDKKNYKKYSKGNEVLQPKPSPNTKKRLVEDKEVEDERDSDVEGSDGESDSDKEHKVSEKAYASNESEEDGKGVMMRSSLDFYTKFYNSLGRAPNRCSSSIGKTRGVVIVHLRNRLGRLDHGLTEF